MNDDMDTADAELRFAMRAADQAASSCCSYRGTAMFLRSAMSAGPP